jgi:pilus assembly protein Flp/PilA
VLRLLDMIRSRRVGLGTTAELSRCLAVITFSGPERVVDMVTRFQQFLANFIEREDGPTAVEYAVMLALIIVVCIAAITSLGTNANATFTSVGNTIGASS